MSKKSVRFILAVVAAAFLLAPGLGFAQANPCAAKNPCAAQNPCSAKNPCAAKADANGEKTSKKGKSEKSSGNPCAANPCAAKKY